jgi:hypothetical protein
MLHVTNHKFYTNRKPFFFTKMFSTRCDLQLQFFNFSIEQWQLPMKLTHQLNWYIIESNFQLGGGLSNISLNILGINNVYKLKYLLHL